MKISYKKLLKSFEENGYVVIPKFLSKREIDFIFRDLHNLINFSLLGAKLKNRVKLKSLDNENKFIVIKDINFLNTNCVNALLKILEDSPENTFFIFTNDIMEKCLDTLKSRMFEKKFFLSKNLYSEIIKNYFEENNYPLNDTINNIFTPGLSLRFLKNFKETCNNDLSSYLSKKNNDFSSYKILSKYMLENNCKYEDFKKLKININFKNDIKNFFKYSG